MALALGTTLGPYEVTAKIGAGGMGEVYRARDTKLDRVKAAYPAAKYERLVALKTKYDPTNLFRLNQNIKPAG